MSRRRKQQQEAYNATDEEQIKAAERQEQSEEKDLAFVMSTERGRRWLYELIYDRCHFMSGSVTQLADGSGDPMMTSYYLGVRGIGQLLEAEARDLPQLYVKMLAENELETD